MKTKILLCLIFLFAFILRFYQLGQIPTSLHADEAVFGYNAYSILKTGKDEYGHFPSLVLEAFGDFRPALYTYLTIPSVAVWGLTEYAVRFPSAVFSFLTVVLFYFLTQKITKNRQLSVYLTLLLAFSFWHLDLSREASEKIMALFLILSGLFFFFLFKENEKKRNLVLAFFLWFLSIHTYYAPRFFLPPFLLLIFFFYRKSLFKKGRIFPISLALILLISIFYFSFFFKGSAVRFAQLNIFSHPEVKLVLEEQIREEPAGTKPLLTRFFHNKVINYSLGALEKYGKYFTVDFLILRGGEPQRVAVPNIGLLSLAELPFLLSGIYFLLKERKIWAYFLFCWIVIAPLPASFTVDETPNVYRSLAMLPALNITTAFGFLKIKNFVSRIGKKLLLPFFLLVGVIFSWNILYYLHQYYVHQRFHRPWHRQYGYKQLVAFISQSYPNYERILITKGHGAPYIFFLFYQEYDPAYYQSLGSPRDPDYGGFDKYTFVPRDCPSQIKEEVMQEKKTLFVDKGECKINPYARVLETISREDNTPAFRLLEVSKKDADIYFKQQEKLILKD